MHVSWMIRGSDEVMFLASKADFLLSLAIIFTMHSQVQDRKGSLDLRLS